MKKFFSILIMTAGIFGGLFLFIIPAKADIITIVDIPAGGATRSGADTVEHWKQTFNSGTGGQVNNISIIWAETEYTADIDVCITAESNSPTAPCISESISFNGILHPGSEICNPDEPGYCADDILTATFPAITLTPNTNYAVSLRQDITGALYRIKATGNVYAQGMAKYYRTSPAGWVDYPTIDISMRIFYEFTNSPALTPVDHMNNLGALVITQMVDVSTYYIIRFWPFFMLLIIFSALILLGYRYIFITSKK